MTKDQPEGSRREALPRTGLTAEEVRQRVAEGKVNTEVNPPSKTISEIIQSNVFTFFNILNFALAACVFLVRSYQNMLFLGVILCNIIIGTVQEIRAKRMVDKLSLISEPQSSVVRDGEKKIIPVSDLVQDDTVILSAGNQICADAVVTEGTIEVNESLITGESDSVVKRQGDEILSGSFVVAGECFAKLIRVGKESYASKLIIDAKKEKKPNSELMKSLNQIIKFVASIILPFGVLLFLKQHFIIGAPFNRAVVSTVAALIGMIPEGLILLTSVALAVGVIRLGRYKTLVQELYCIETLARVDVLCLDKTGTITEGTMQYKGMIPLGDGKEEEIHAAVSALTHTLHDDNTTFMALKEYFTDDPGWTCGRAVPFSSQRKWSGASFTGKGAYVIGAPEFVMREGYEALRKTVEEYAAQGNRTLLLARCGEEYQEDEERFPSPEPVALLLIADKIRQEAPETFRFFRDQGVTIKVISGDNPLTVSEVAHRAGVEDAHNYVDASTLKTEEDVERAALEYTVFGRVTPPQKRILVRSLKQAGHTVAMTGDGVNDVLALKDADCSIAMASGSDAARHVSQLVLLDSNFASMPRVVLEGRRVINNIQRSASLFLVKTGYSFLMSILLLIFPFTYPFMPIQLTLISAITIGMPSFFLALEPNKSLVKGRFLTNVFNKALPGALSIVANLLLLMTAAHFLHLPFGEVSTIAVVSTGAIGLMILASICVPFDLKRKILCVVQAALFILAIVLAGRFFSLVPLHWIGWIVLGCLLLAAYPIFKGFHRLVALLRPIDRWNNWHDGYLLRKAAKKENAHR